MNKVPKKTKRAKNRQEPQTHHHKLADVARELGEDRVRIQKWVVQDKVCGDPKTLSRGKRNSYLLTAECVDRLNRLSNFSGLHLLTERWPIKELVDILNYEDGGEPELAEIALQELAEQLDGALSLVRGEAQRIYAKVHGDKPIDPEEVD